MSLEFLGSVLSRVLGKRTIKIQMHSKEYMCVLRENSLNNTRMGELQLRKGSS